MSLIPERISDMYDDFDDAGYDGGLHSAASDYIVELLNEIDKLNSSKTDSEYGEPVKQILVKYPDCNATENLFGGKLLSWIDEAAAIFASRHMEEDLIVTKWFGGLEFVAPAELRKVVTIYAKVLKEGTTSMRVGVVATKKSMGDNSETLIASTEVVFVAVDSNMNKKPWKPMRFEKCPYCFFPIQKTILTPPDAGTAIGCTECSWQAYDKNS
jgi:acyl-CoA thioesterase YciA